VNGRAPRACLAVLGVPLAMAAQVQAQTPPTPLFTSETGVINLVVTVQDKQGNWISDLGADDFAVFDDGKPAPITLFARSAEDKDNDENLMVDAGLLLDTSESMKPALKLAQEAAIRFLDSVPRARDLLTLFFDQDIRVSRYDSEHQQGLFERILESQAAGNTALYDAITVYISRVSESGGRKVLVLFTDGSDTLSKTDVGEVKALARSSSVTIYPVSFADTLPSSEMTRAKVFLRDLADITGGKVYTPRTSKNLGEVFDKIISELKTQYVIGIAPGPQAADGKYHKLRVEVKGRSLDIRHRLGYIIEPPE
jgi:Ca-activated chloride channel homolog